MKYRHLFWAIILISAGILALLGNLGVIHFSWLAVWRLWPLILILWGVSILPLKDTVKTILLVAVIFLTFLVYNRLDENAPWYLRFDREFSDDFHGRWDKDDETYNYREQHFSVPMDTAFPRGRLSLDAAAGNFTIEDTTGDFLEFNKSGYVGNYELVTSEEKGQKQIRLKMSEAKVRRSIKENNVTIRLNPSVSWNLDFSIGAAAIVMDLSDYKVDTANFEAGASSIELTLGNKSPLTVVTLDAGASSIEVRIPVTSGCQITSESFMVSREFQDFEKKGDHMYQTPGFATAPEKIYIRVKTAISKIKVDRY